MRAETQRGEQKIPERRVNAHGRTMRAYRAYVELRDTANWLHEELTAQLRNFHLTMMDFRVLDMLRRCGPQYLEAMSRRFRCHKQNIANVIKRLEAAGWVRRTPSRLRPGGAGTEGGRARKRPGRGDSQGRRVVRLEMTQEGRAHLKDVLPRHVKLVKAHMRTLDQREQLTLGRLCRKLRRGDILKFALEVRWWERDENWAEL